MDYIPLISRRENHKMAAAILKNSRAWHREQQFLHPTHVAVLAALDSVPALDWQQLVLEWPYMSDTDKTRIAYTRDEMHGETNRQTITSVGKYLARHFPTLPSHTVRDLVAKHCTASRFSVSHDIEDIVEAAQEGPPSCMQWDADEIDRHGHHPYETYAPKYGWGIAVRRDGDTINGRALVMERQDEDGGVKYYVRTFNRHADGGRSYSQPDDQLDQWLKAQGYQHNCGWHSEKLAYIESENSRSDSDFMAPYLDGDDQYVDVEQEHIDGKYRRFLRIDSSGEYKCNNTDGSAEQEDSCTCECCGNRIGRNDNNISVGRHEDTLVGECCIDEYTYVYGRNANQYYIRNDDAVNVDDEMYDPQYLADNDITVLHDGDYCHDDNCVYIETESEYYHIDDDDIVRDYDGIYQLESNCVGLADDGGYALDIETFLCENRYVSDLLKRVRPIVMEVLKYPPDAVSLLETATEWVEQGQGPSAAEQLEPLPAIDEGLFYREIYMRDLRGNVVEVHPNWTKFYADLGWALVTEQETETA